MPACFSKMNEEVNNSRAESEERVALVRVVGSTMVVVLVRMEVIVYSELWALSVASGGTRI